MKKIFFFFKLKFQTLVPNKGYGSYRKIQNLKKLSMPGQKSTGTLGIPI